LAKQNSDKASWLRPIPKEFAQKAMTSKRRAIFSSVTVAVLVGFSVVIWLSYTSETTEIGPVPVVRADNSVVKVNPDEPGGIEIPFQDKEVFARVDNLPKEEDDIIASSAEIPLKRPAPKVIEEVVPEETAVEVAKAVEEITPAATVTPPAAKTGDYMIQIAAIDTIAKAEAIWMSAVRKNSAALVELTPEFMRVDLGAKGVMYRVRGGMFETRQAAANICASLKNNNQDCLVVSK